MHCISSYRVSDEDLHGIIFTAANTIFNQAWELQGDLETIDHTNDSNSDVEQLSIVGVLCKKLHVCTKTYNVFSSRRTINRYIGDGSILSLRHVCESIINAKPDESLTWGVDYITNAAGHRLYDVKQTILQLCQKMNKNGHLLQDINQMLVIVLKTVLLHS